MSDFKPNPDYFTCGECLNSLGVGSLLPCPSCQLAAVTKERDDLKLFAVSVAKSMGAEDTTGSNDELMAFSASRLIEVIRGYQDSERTSSHYLTLLREIELFDHTSSSCPVGDVRFRSCVRPVLSRIPAEPAPCQDSQPVSPEAKSSPETNSVECHGCASRQLLINRIDAQYSLTRDEVLNGNWGAEFDVNNVLDVVDALCIWRDFDVTPCPHCAELKAGIAERDRVLDEVERRRQEWWEADRDDAMFNNFLLHDLSTRPATDKPEGG